MMNFPKSMVTSWIQKTGILFSHRRWSFLKPSQFWSFVQFWQPWDTSWGLELVLVRSTSISVTISLQCFVLVKAEVAHSPCSELPVDCVHCLWQPTANSWSAGFLQSGTLLIMVRVSGSIKGLLLSVKPEKARRLCYPNFSAWTSRTSASSADLSTRINQENEASVGREDAGREVHEAEKVSREHSDVPTFSWTNFSGADGSDPSSGLRLHEENGSFQDLCKKQASQTSSYQQVGRELHYLSESSLLQRDRRLRRLQDSGRIGGCKARCKSKRGPSQIKEVSAGVGKVGSCKNKTTNALSLGSSSLLQHAGEKPGRSCVDGASQLRCVPSTFRGSHFARGGRCGSHKVTSSSGFEFTSRRAVGDFKNGTGQRKHSLGFSSHAFPQRGFEETGSTQKGQVSLQSGLSSASQHLGGQHERHWVAQEPLSAVPVEAQRTFARSSAQPSVGSGSQDEGQMACRLFGQKIRGSCTASSTIPAALKPTSGEVSFSSDSVRTAGPKIFSPKPDSKKACWVVEFFSGCANLSKQFAAVGFHALAYDIIYGPGNDLLCESTLKSAFKFLKTHRVALVWLGTPCKSWSRARKHDGGPPPLRDDDEGLFGLKGLKPHDLQKVVLGNRLVDITLRIISLCNQLKIRWVLENPWTSRLWLVPSIRQMCNETSLLRTDYCQFNQPWRKSTGLLQCRFPELKSITRVCHPKNNRCSASRRPHIVLQGKDSQGGYQVIVAPKKYSPEKKLSATVGFSNPKP